MLVDRTAVSSGEFQMLEGGLKRLIVKVQWVDMLGRAAALWVTDTGQYGFEDLFSQDKQRSESSDTGPSDSVTAAVGDTFYQSFAV